MDEHAARPGRVGVVGAGRAGRVMGAALRRAGWTVAAAHARSAAGRAAASRVLGVDATDDPALVLAACDVLLLCVPDDAVAPLARSLARASTEARPAVVVLSGSVSLEELDPLRARGHEVLRLHPLRALTHDSSPDDLAGAPAAITAVTMEGRELGHELAAAVRLVPFDLDEELRATWHAAATVAANYPVVLLAAARDLAVLAGVEPPEALSAMSRLMQDAVRQAGRASPEVALTGPVSRGDAGTVAEHLDALRRLAPRLEPAWRELAIEASRLAVSSGRLDAAAAERVREAAAGSRRGPGELVVVESVDELRRTIGQLAAGGRRIGFVPTMGALHPGHAELVRTARAECDMVVVSCFVNPTQFGPGEDLDRYPRTPDADERVVRGCGADLLWRPRVEDVYGDGDAGATTVTVGSLGSVLEGAARPGHFDGVASVVVRLLGAVQPQVLYLGAKDHQQVAVLRRVVRDLLIPVELRVVPTVRDVDGLALSSRNAYLDDSERRAALAIPASIDTARELHARGERSHAVLRARTLERLTAEPLVRVDYVELADAETLEPVDPVEGDAVLLVAARVGATRLIDNVPLTATPQEAARP